MFEKFSINLLGVKQFQTVKPTTCSSWDAVFEKRSHRWPIYWLRYLFVQIDLFVIYIQSVLKMELPGWKHSSFEDGRADICYDLIHVRPRLFRSQTEMYWHCCCLVQTFSYNLGFRRQFSVDAN